MGTDQADQHGMRPTTLRALRSTVGRESTTFGFSILVTVTFAVMQNLHGTPGMAEIFAYAAGAVLSFTVLEGLLSGGFRRPMPQHPTQTLALGTSMNVLSVGLGMGAGWLVGTLLTGLLAWILAPLTGSIVYLLLESAEAAIAEKILLAKGDPDADRTTP
ncbi:hypothetical protein [Kocuria sp. KH4]